MADLTCTGGFITPTEIVNAVNTRVEENVAITPATNTKITYDAKGLVTSGEAATTADIADSVDKRYVTDAESTVIDNTSGTNSGNQSSSDFTHDDLTGVTANEHLDWTASVGTIHTDNYVENVSTELSNGTASTTVVNVTSDGGTDDLVITAASTSKAGIMTKAIFDEHVANNGKVTNATTNLTQTTATTNLTILSSDGDDIVVAAATTLIAGLMTNAMFDEHVINNGKETNEVSDLALGTPTATTYPITNSDGTGFSIPEADTTNAGLLGSDMWDKLDGIEASADVNEFSFKTVTSDSGSAIADTTTDTLEILGGTAISTTVTTDTLTINGVAETYTEHENISAATSEDNSGRTYIQDVTVDSNGHVTGLATATETVTDTTYDGGTGITLNAGNFDHDSHSGDVTGSTELTIGNDKVTYAKMQNVVDDERVLGRVSGADGVVEELTAAQMKTMLAYLTDLLDDTSPQLGGDLEFNGKTANVSAVRGLTDTSGTGTITLAYASGDMRQHTATGNCLLAFSGFPAGDVCGYILDCYDFGDYTITYPANTRFAAGIAPAYTSNGYDRILIMKDRDNVYTITVIALDHKAEV